MKKYLLIFTILLNITFLISACGGKSEKPQNSEDVSSEETTEDDAEEEPATYDPKRGEGKFDATNVKVGALDGTMANKGKSISATKCTSCHKLTDEKLVGPGWKGVTERREPHWIMNFITNPDPMIDKDPEVQAQLELCLVRMPNQSLADDEARNILEYMRQNDGSK